MEKKARPSARTCCIVANKDGTADVLQCEDAEIKGRPGVRRIRRRISNLASRGRAVELANKLSGKG